MGYIPPSPPREPFRLNVDRHGMPRDYATYMWMLYGRRVEDKSPERWAFRAALQPRTSDPGRRETR